MPGAGNNILIFSHNISKWWWALSILFNTLITMPALSDTNNNAELLPIIICSPKQAAEKFYDPLATGSVGNIKLMESTHTVEIIEPDLINLTGAERLEETTAYLPGLTPSSMQAGYNTAITVRGFNSEGDVFLNGHRDNHQFLIRDLHTVERVEILKGHGSVLYGSGTPGATLNYLTKQPEPDPLTILGLSVGNDDFLRATLDSTGPLDDSKNLLYRLVASRQDGDTLYENVSNQRWDLFPSLQWNYSADGSLRLEFEHTREFRPYYFGTVYTKNQILFDHSYVLPEAKADKTFERAGLYWQQHLNEQFEIKASANHFTTRRNDRQAGFIAKKDEESLNGYYRLVDDDYQQDSIKLELLSTFSSGRVSHHLLSGLEYNDDTDDVKSQRNIGGFTLDPFNPDLNIDLDSLPLTTRNYISENTETGLYLFDRIDLSEAFSIEAGLRHSEYKAHFQREGTNTKMTDNSLLSKTLGLVWQPQETAALHFSLSESFTPNWGTDIDGDFLDPKTARQIEAGIRHLYADRQTSFEASIYQLTQDNITAPEPLDPDSKVLTGERRSRGLELAFGFTPSSTFDLTATYSYIDAEITRNNEGKAGNTPASIPNHSGSIRLDYRPARQVNWKLFGGIHVVDRRFGDDENSFKVPGYGLLNLGVQYARKELKATLSITNAFDKRYISSSFLEDDIYQGDRRTVKLSTEYAF